VASPDRRSGVSRAGVTGQWRLRPRVMTTPRRAAGLVASFSFRAQRDSRSWFSACSSSSGSRVATTGYLVSIARCVHCSK